MGVCTPLRPRHLKSLPTLSAKPAKVWELALFALSNSAPDLSFGGCVTAPLELASSRQSRSSTGTRMVNDSLIVRRRIFSHVATGTTRVASIVVPQCRRPDGGNRGFP